VSKAAEIALFYTPDAEIDSEGNYKINCPNPGHPDNNPSCIVKDRDNGGVAVWCFVCRDSPAILAGMKADGIYGAPKDQGATRRKMSPNNPAPIAAPVAQKKKKEIKYRDELPQNHEGSFEYKRKGEIAYVKQRYTIKGERVFGYWTFDKEKNQWKNTREGVEPIIWQIDKIEEAAAQQEPIFIVEGEKDVLTIERISEGVLFATTSDTSSFWPEQHTEALKGASCVYIIPDNDKAGEKHLNVVGAKLVEAGFETKVIRLPGVKDKGDITDWIEENGKTFEDLVYAMEAATPFELPQAVEEPQLNFASLETSAKEKLPPITKDELRAKREQKRNGGLDLLDLGDSPAGDIANGKRLIRFADGNLKWATEGIWCRYQDGIWRQTDDRQVEVSGMAQQVMPLITKEAEALEGIADHALQKEMVKWAKECNTHLVRVKAMVEAAKPHAMCSIKDFDNEKHIVNLKNVLVDLRTGKAMPHDRARMNMKQIGINYNPNADSPDWREFIEQITNGDYEKAAFIQKMAGYSLTGETKEQKAIFLHGPGGNGKGILVNTLLKVNQGYGTMARKEMFMQTHLKDHSDNASVLLGKRFVSISEIEQKDRINQGFFKDVTGGDRVRGRLMRCESFEYFPEAKLWFSTNFLPGIDDSSESVWRRILVVNLDQIFDNPDVNLADRLSTPENLEGILKWIIDGAGAWYREGLCPPRIIIDDTKAYRGDQDRLGNYLAECVEFGPYECTTKDFFEDWSIYCKAGNFHPGQLMPFGKNLKNRVLREKLAVEPKKWTNGNGFSGMIPTRVKEREASGNYLGKRTEKEDED